MKYRKLGYLILFPLAAIAFVSCDGVQRDPLEKQGASSVVRPAVPVAPANSTLGDTVSMDRMDTATNPTMDGKP